MLRRLRYLPDATLATLRVAAVLGESAERFELLELYADGDAAIPFRLGHAVRAMYLLSAVAPLAVCAAWALVWLRRAGRLVMMAVLALLAYAALLNVDFLVLPA